MGYVRELDFVIQMRSSSGATAFDKITAGSEKHARKKMNQKRQERNFQEGIVVVNIKSNGNLGKLGDGTLPNTSETLEEAVERATDE